MIDEERRFVCDSFHGCILAQVATINVLEAAGLLDRAAVRAVLQAEIDRYAALGFSQDKLRALTGMLFLLRPLEAEPSADTTKTPPFLRLVDMREGL